jgi:hypothetical protein
MSHFRLGDKHVESLCSALKVGLRSASSWPAQTLPAHARAQGNTALDTLSIVDCYLEDAGATSLADALSVRAASMLHLGAAADAFRPIRSTRASGSLTFRTTASRSTAPSRSHERCATASRASPRYRWRTTPSRTRARAPYARDWCDALAALPSLRLPSCVQRACCRGAEEHTDHSAAQRCEHGQGGHACRSQDDQGAHAAYAEAPRPPKRRAQESSCIVSVEITGNVIHEATEALVDAVKVRWRLRMQQAHALRLHQLHCADVSVPPVCALGAARVGVDPRQRAERGVGAEHAQRGSSADNPPPQRNLDRTREAQTKRALLMTRGYEVAAAGARGEARQGVSCPSRRRRS